MRITCIAGALIAVVGMRAGNAQSVGDAAAYTALVSTPAASISPVVFPYMTGDQQSSVGVAGHFGRTSGNGFSTNGFAADLTFPAGKGSGGVIVGYLNNSCEGCESFFMAGAHVEGAIVTAGSPGSLFAVGLQGTAGFAKPSGGSAWSLAAEVPISYAVAAGRVHIVPFLTPGYGLGIVTGAGSSETGTRPMLGAGVGIVGLAPGLGVTVSAKKVFITHGTTVFGAGVSWAALR